MNNPLTISPQEGDTASTVAQYHRYIDELLCLAQQALVEKDRDLALQFWQLHIAMLSIHVAIEDDCLAQVSGEEQKQWRWPASLYVAEHAKIIQFGSKVEARLKALPEVLTAPQIIAEIDFQRSYKNLLQHHEEREEIALLQEMASTSPAVMALFDRRIHQQWQDCYHQQKHSLTRLQQHLVRLKG